MNELYGSIPWAVFMSDEELIHAFAMCSGLPSVSLLVGLTALSFVIRDRRRSKRPPAASPEKLNWPTSN